MRIATFTAVAGALALGLTFGAPSQASAASSAERVATPAGTATTAPMEMQRRYYRGGPRYHGRGWRGPSGAAIGLGIAGAIIAGGAAAAASQPYYRECWVERRWVDTPWGPEPRRVRVCN